MAETTSWAFPNMINVAQNQVAILEDNMSIVNRDRLLLLSDPTELYNEPDFGVGLKKYLFQYNNQNTVARLQDTIREKLSQYEPYVDPDKTRFADGLLYTGGSEDDSIDQKYNELDMTVQLETKFGDVTVNSSFEEG